MYVVNHLILLGHSCGPPVSSLPRDQIDLGWNSASQNGTCFDYEPISISREESRGEQCIVEKAMSDKKKKAKWDALEKLMTNKRTKRTSKEKSSKKISSCIMVQRMSSQPTGRQKKYEPLDTKDFEISRQVI